jgi:NCAIR mutase (PurE)-related protein
VQPSPLDDDPPSRDEAGGFAPLLVPPDPPLAPGGGDPLLGPVPAATAPARAADPDVVWATGRTTDEVLALVREARREHPDRPALVLRATAETLVALAAEHDAYTTMDAAALAAAVGPMPEPAGRVRVLCAGGADLPVAAEVGFVARVAGTEVVRADDVAGSRLRARLADGSLFEDVDCLVVVAGMDASLATTIAAATDLPVVAVPTSTGRAAVFGGLGALMTMLGSAAPGIVVSTVDDGWSAGVFAARVARRSARR